VPLKYAGSRNEINDRAPLYSSALIKEVVISDMQEKVKEVIEREIRPFLVMDGGDIELVSVEDGVVRVRLRGACGCCPMSQYTLVNFVEATLKDKIPEVKQVIPVEDFTDKFGIGKVC
jgi:Fe-S cluster biogenesis protein NfuA